MRFAITKAILALGALCAFASGYLLGKPSATPSRGVTLTTVEPSSHSQPAADSLRHGHGAASALLEQPSFRWSVLESRDLREYARNLRAFGCPEDIIAGILRPEVTKLIIQTNSIVTDSIKRAQDPGAWIRAQTARKQQRETCFDSIAYDQLGLRRPASALFTETEEARIAEAAKRFPRATDGKGTTGMKERVDFLADHLSPVQLQTYVLEREPLGRTIKFFVWGMNPTQDEFMAVASALEQAEGSFAMTSDLKAKLQASLSPERYQLLEDLQTTPLKAMQPFARRYRLTDDTVQQLIELRRSTVDISSPDYKEGASRILKDPAVATAFLNDPAIKQPLRVPRASQ